MDSWLTEARNAVAEAAGVDASSLELTESDVTVLLDVARIAARDSGERTNAPLLCYLIGRAQVGGANLESLADAVRK